MGQRCNPHELRVSLEKWWTDEWYFGSELENEKEPIKTGSETDNGCLLEE